ncbi:MAG TPA: MBL fold metallo-hydrolase [Pirellulaceae bacterium]|nr:MBL fold metallo-hydrolase [Pirellulaceae bacterium]
MRIRLCGAAGEVTGSCYLVETDRAQVLVDFGMFQGTATARAQNREHAWLAAKKLDAVVLTHGHLDHIGRLPILVRQGFKGPIFATPSSIEVAKLILLDSAGLQAADAKRANLKRVRSGMAPLPPLYEEPDVERLMAFMQPIEYGERREIAPGISVRLEDAGHILGSASIEMTVEENGQQRVIVFSGDIGPKGAPLLRDPTTFDHADLVFLESTYGDRDHRPLDETVVEFREILQAAQRMNAKVLIPAFAIGRTQQILFHLATMIRQGELRRLPIYIDSPMAIKATEIYHRHPSVMDDETKALNAVKQLASDLSEVRYSVTAQESMQLNDTNEACLIIAGSGMCNGGRILHHFKHGLWRENVHVVIVGFQGHGTLGDALVHGARYVKIHGERVIVRAKVHTLGGFSAHAGRTELLEWFAPLAKSQPRVVLTHGEPSPRKSLGEELGRRYGVRAEYPLLGDSIEL